MSFLDGLLRDRFSTDGITYYQRTYIDLTGVTISDSAANDKVTISFASLSGSGGIQYTTANVDAYAPSGASVKSYFAPATDTTTTNATPTDAALLFGTTPIGINYTTCLVHVYAMTFGWKTNADYAIYYRKRVFVGASGTMTALGATADSATADTNGGAGAWTAPIIASTGSDPDFKLTYTGVAATTIIWRSIVQISAGVIVP